MKIAPQTLTRLEQDVWQLETTMQLVMGDTREGAALLANAYRRLQETKTEIKLVKMVSGE